VGRPGRSWRNNIKINIKETGCEWLRLGSSGGGGDFGCQEGLCSLWSVSM
jgi:hypothetical protein